MEIIVAYGLELAVKIVQLFTLAARAPQLSREQITEEIARIRSNEKEMDEAEWKTVRGAGANNP